MNHSRILFTDILLIRTPLNYDRYWWNTRIFPFTKKSYLHRAQWRYYFCLSRVRILVSPWLLTFWNKKYKYYCLYFSFITLYPSFITLLWQAFCDRWPLYVGISSVSIKWTEHYMAAWGYEFYLLVLKVSLTRSLLSLMSSCRCS